MVAWFWFDEIGGPAETLKRESLREWAREELE
jgi:hypothetical protein